ncbi:MAG: DinB family protein [Chloroflexi bacterium]|nr:DinB family protein [Chloroflexota bacterium]
MLLDFTRLNNKEVTIFEFSKPLTLDDLRAATNGSIDRMEDLLKDTDDEQITFIPYDPDADDPFAPADERYQGWNLAHLVLHVTASAEEGAAFGSLLARGVVLPQGVRLRYEPDWHLVKTRAEVLHRLEESRRIRLSYLNTWPDQPHLDTFREFSPESHSYRQLNAVASVVGGLRHENNHFEQMRRTLEQAVNVVYTGD